MKDFNNNLLEFLNNGTCSFTTLLEIKKILDNNGYQELSEFDSWDLENDKYYVIRNDASIIAFNINKNIKNQFNIICTHNDTPAFTIKPNPEYFENGYLKLNVAPYGGILNYGFMDRPLGIAGRLILKNENEFTKKIIDTKDSVAIIPSIAIHQNDSANSNLDINTEIDLMPIISQDKNYSLSKLLKNKLNINEEIYEYDLFLYNKDLATIINDEFIASPRIDNLTCTYAALEAFLNNINDSINVLAVFNSEEIGSNTLEGADSNFLIDTLKKICKILDLELTTTLANSLIISADNTHARHPNHDELSDHTNTPLLNDGILIMKEMNGTTNSITSSIFKYICEKNKLPYTYYTSRNDFATGSTQAGASLKHLSINSLDVGLPMLAMHSGLEVIGIKDTYLLYKAFKKFYQIKYQMKDNKIKFI
ncbi:MAG: M18 family aminopeptidase [Firmicutes bacterium]|nr:M18 family aminopeptidase [Bacillota bacterium]